jgi:membrane-associated phospholipid phosphatase
MAAIPAAAQMTDQAPQPRISWLADGIVTGAGVGLTLGASLIPVDTSRRWRREPFPFDQGTRGGFSASIDGLSNGLLMLTVMMPVALQTSRGFWPGTATRLLIYGETLSLTLAINTLVKSLVGRPRPYMYGEATHLKAYAKGRGRDTHLSFFSGHSAVTFAAAVSGSYLFAQTSEDAGARAVVWGAELLVAGMAAGFRVRAGQHFPSDVLVGAMVGAWLGATIPYLHYLGRGPHPLGVAEVVTLAVAPGLGAFLSAVLPIGPPASVPPKDSVPSRVTWLLAPWGVPRGAGMALLGWF